MKIRLILAIAALVALPQLVKAQLDGQRGKGVKFHHELNVSFGLGPNMTDRVFDKLKAPYLDKYHLEYEGECFDVIGESFLTLSLQYHFIHPPLFSFRHLYLKVFCLTFRVHFTVPSFTVCDMKRGEPRRTHLFYNNKALR